MLHAGVLEGAHRADQYVTVRTVVLGRFGAVHHERDPRQRPEHESDQDDSDPRDPAGERLQSGPDVDRLAVRTGGHVGRLPAEVGREPRNLAIHRRRTRRWGSKHDPKSRVRHEGHHDTVVRGYDGGGRCKSDRDASCWRLRYL